MGKAAILVWPTVVVVLGLIGYGIARLVHKTPQESKSVRLKAELVDEAHRMFVDMLFPQHLNDMTILTETDKTKIRSWAEKYRKANS